MSVGERAVEVGLLEELRAAWPEQRRDRLLRHLSEQAAAVMGLGAAQAPGLGVTDRIFELGLGSLQIVELKAHLEKAFEVELPVALFFSHTSLRELADHLLGEVLRLDDTTASPVPAAASEDSTDPRPLSGQTEDAEAALLRKIESVEAKFDL